MSERRGMINRGSLKTVFAALIILITSAGLFNPASAQYGPDYQLHFFVPQGPVEPGSVFKLELRFWDPYTSFGAQEFYIQMWYPDSVVSPLYAVAGELLDDCGWTLQVEYPSPGLIRLHGKAPEGVEDPNDECFLQGAAGPLALIFMQAANDSSYRCNFFPFRFYWDSCGDNIFITPGADSILLSESVYSSSSDDPYPLDSFPPTFWGAPAICMNDTILGAVPARRTNFFEGGVFIACAQNYEYGDLNMNYIAYEIADYVLYIDYFLYGTSVFTVDSALQIVLSDVNVDAIPLSLNDLVYMNRIIIGDAIPIEGRKSIAGSDTASFIQDFSQKKISLISPDSLGAARFVFQGEIIPKAIDINGLWMSYSHANGKTTVLICPYGLDRTLYAGDLFSYSGYGTLTEVQAGDYQGLAYYIGDYTILGDEAVCGDVDGNGLISVTDVVRLINCIFLISPECPPLERGDVNCDGFIDVADIVWLLNYIFIGGNAPCDTNGDGVRDC